MSSRSERSLSYARKRCFENCLSIYGLLRIQRHSLYFFFFLFLSHVYFFSFYSHKLSLTLSPSFSLYSSRSTVTSRAQRRGLFLFFFSFFYLRNIVWHRVRVSSVFPYYEIKRFLCRLVACQHLLG